jgi:hypothetical protein
MNLLKSANYSLNKRCESGCLILLCSFVIQLSRKTFISIFELQMTIFSNYQTEGLICSKNNASIILQLLLSIDFLSYFQMPYTTFFFSNCFNLFLSLDRFHIYDIRFLSFGYIGNISVLIYRKG